MTATTSEAPALPKHAWSAQYLRLRAIAILLGIPTRLIVNLAYYCYDPFTLRKYQVQRRRIWIPSRERGRTIKVDVYEPIKRTKKPLPVHINWHGSGFVIPCHGVDATLCIYLASTLGCTVLDADYRKAPAHPFPAGQQDTEDACLYVLAHPEMYDVTKVSIGGTSAGACLALSTAAKLGPKKIQAVCCMAAATNMQKTPHPKQAFDPGTHKRALPFWAVRYFVTCYIVGDVDRTDPLLSPFHAATSDFPSTVYLTTGTGDTLYWDSKNLVNRLTAEGHPSAIFRPAVGMGHAPGLFRPDDPTNLPLLMYTDIVNNIRKSWSQPRGRRESKM